MACMYVCVYVCMCVCMCMCVRMYVRTYACRSRKKGGCALFLMHSKPKLRGIPEPCSTLGACSTLALHHLHLFLHDLVFLGSRRA